LTIVEDILAQIDAAFSDMPRPSNDDLLHPSCFADNDIAELYGVRDWHDLADTTVENEYAALAFLSPEGFRFFIPAYMTFSMRHPASGAAAVQSTLMSLSPNYDCAFTPSKFIHFDEAQRSAVISFLEAMSEYDDVDDAHMFWQLSVETA
jgi:Family of unknown function (DUF6714)